jgi:hypothetical protein
MKTFTKLFIVVFFLVLIGGLTQQRELVNMWMGQIARYVGVKDEIYHWNTSIAWEKTDREHELLETGEWIQREFRFMEYTIRARENSDGSVLAAVYFWDDCQHGTSIMTDVLDYDGEPYEMRCAEYENLHGWRVGARLPNTQASWFERYGDYSVRASFNDWDFGIIEKYGGALELQPDQISN